LLDPITRVELGQGLLTQIAALLKAEPRPQSQLQWIERITQLSASGRNALTQAQPLLLRSGDGLNSTKGLWQGLLGIQQPGAARQTPARSTVGTAALHQAMPVPELRQAKAHIICREQHAIESLMNGLGITSGDDQVSAIGAHLHRSQGHHARCGGDAAGVVLLTGMRMEKVLGGLAMEHPQGIRAIERQHPDRQHEVERLLR
tara:strand:+ start:4171 stop:4779 length:609 start_codon:yes stop_codon:yes gene_type:complete